MDSDIAELNPTEVHRWIVLLKNGGEHAALNLFHFCHPVVNQVIHSRLPRRARGEDLKQEICGKMCSRSDHYSGKVPFLNGGSRIAVNARINLHRKQEVRPGLRMAGLSEEAESTREPTRCDPLGTTEGIPAKELVHKLLEILKPNDRRLVDLLFVQGDACPEMVQLTGWKSSVAKTRDVIESEGQQTKTGDERMNERHRAAGQRVGPASPSRPMGVGLSGDLGGGSERDWMRQAARADHRLAGQGDGPHLAPRFQSHPKTRICQLRQKLTDPLKVFLSEPLASPAL